MNVFVLNMEYAYGIINGTDCMGVYDTEEKAQKAMEEKIDISEKKWKEQWDADSTKHLNIIKGKRNGVISAVGPYKYFTITEKEIE